jgi:hypothetical protein
MTVFIENPVAIAVFGALAATFALVVYLARRNFGSLVAIAGVAALTLLMLVVEKLVVTDREAVEAAVVEVFDAIESNDLPGVLEWIDPAAANVKADAESLMPEVKVSMANAAAIEVEVNDDADPPTAKSQCRAYLNGVHGSSGMAMPYMNQRVDLNWVKRGNQWRITGYQAYYDDQPIDAVGSARGNRVVPGR